MKFSLPIILSLVSVIAANQAPKNVDNIKGTIAVASLPKGNVVFYTKRGQQVKVHVDVTGFPESGGPFQYHIHENPIPANGDCEAAGNHFNPFSASPNCDEEIDDSYCQVGDLSGKHGWIDTTCFETKYYDPYLSLVPGNPAYIVGKSVVFHYANLNKFACANIELASGARLAEIINQLRAKGDVEFNNLEYNDEADLNLLDLSVLKASDSADPVEEPVERKEQEWQRPSLNQTAAANGDADCDDENKGNLTNSSSVYHYISTDCENSGLSLRSSSFLVGSALVLGLLV